MYENNIYSNSENGSYTTFQTGSSAYSADGTYNTGAGSSNGKKEGKKKKGVFRKFALSMGLGLAFGAFAGAGFYGIRWGAGQLNLDGASAAVSEGTSEEIRPASGTPMKIGRAHV